MPHQRKHLVVDQGADFDSGSLVAYKPDGTVLNLTGATLRGEVRDRVSGGLYLTLTLAVISAVAGTFRITLTGEQTTILGAASELFDGNGVYDVEAEIAGVEYRILSGSFRVTAEVTREAESS